MVGLQQALAAAAQRLDKPIADPSRDSVSLVFDGDRVKADPKLVYYPAVPVQERNYDRAIAVFRELARSPDEY